jgi:AcrR family transcriptional regulator
MDSTEARILLAAGEIFAEKGYEAATVRDICKRAEVHNLAAVNYYFGDKAKLYNAAVKQAFMGRTDANEPTQWPEASSPAYQLREFLKRFVEGMIGTDRPAWHLHLIARELTTPTEGCLAFVREFAEPHFRTLMAILGQVMPAATTAETSHLIAISIIGQCVHHRCARTIIEKLVGEDEANRYTAPRLAQHIADFSLAALGLDLPLPLKESNDELARVPDVDGRPQ